MASVLFFTRLAQGWVQRLARALTRSEWSEELARAIEGEDRSALREALARGADPNARERGQEGPLASAAAAGWTPGVEDLLQAGAEAKEVGPYGSTALFRALESAPEPLGCVKALLRAGADPNQAIADGFAPLALAALRGLIPEARALLGAGANPNPERGESPLTVAVMTENKPMLELLLRSGAQREQARAVAEQKGLAEWMAESEAKEEREQLDQQTRVGARKSSTRAI